MALHTGVTVRLLGPVTASIGGRLVDLGPPRQRALFAALAARPNRAVTRGELIDAVWGSEVPATVVSSVHTYVGRLRGRLEPERGRRARSRVLLSEGSGYALQVADGDVDAHAFEQSLERARLLRAGNMLAEAIEELNVGLELWRGTAFDGAAGPFVEAERARLDELRLCALEDRAEMLLELDQPAVGIGELVRLVRQFPMRERLRYLLILGYVRLDSRAAALAEFRDVRRTLAEELGIEPGPALQSLHERILRGERDMATYGGMNFGAAVQTGRESKVGPAQLKRDVPGFTGRAAELNALRSLVAAAEAAHEAAVVLINGAPGVGKTALALRFAHALSDRYPDGQLYLDLQGFSGAPGPMPPAEALEHLLAGLGVASPEPHSIERQSALFRSAMAGKRMLVVLDNARSIEQIRPLLPGQRLSVVLATSRAGLTGLIARDGARGLQLDVLPEDDQVALLRSATGCPSHRVDDAALRALARRCGGVPLALRVAAERIRSGSAPEAVIDELMSAHNLLDHLQIPGDPHANVRTVFNWSYRALPDEAARLFRSLGASGHRTFCLSSAASVAGCARRLTRRMLDTLVDAHLIRQQGPEHYAFDRFTGAYAADLAASLDEGMSAPADTTSGDASSAALPAQTPLEDRHRAV